ncbi:MAG: cytochrome C oxidase subunit IV family protein [Dehalococcoidia bacterium]
MSSSHEAHDPHHPTFKQYVIVAVFLFVITAIEFLIIVPDNNKGAGWTIAPLAILSIIKFGTVIGFYMHLKFDNKLFTWIFLGGLALGTAVVFALVGLFLSFTPSARDFAQANAVAFEHGSEGGEHVTATEPVPEAAPPETQPSGPSGSEPPAVPATSTVDGEAVFTGKGACGACHTIEGITTGAVGPDLTHIGTDAAERQDGVTARDYITESIESPEAFVATGVERAIPGVMTSAVVSSLTEDDVAALVEFLLAQK